HSSHRLPPDAGAQGGGTRGIERGDPPRNPGGGGGGALIILKSEREIALMREAGHILADAMERLRASVRPGVSTLEVDEEVQAFILRRGALPAFKGYRGFPATVCVSINEEVVHGIPSPHRRLAEGDIVGLDLGCIVEGYYADCAFTVPVGTVPANVQKLLDVTRESLEQIGRAHV